MSSTSLATKTKQQLIEEVERLQARVAELEQQEPSERLTDAERFQILIHNTLDGYCKIDTDQNIREMNEAFQQMTGYSQDELQHMNLFDLVAGEALEETRQTMDAIATTGRRRFETRFARKDGSLIDMEVNVRNFGATDSHRYCFLRDITKRAQNDAALRLAQYTLDHASEAIIWVDESGTLVYANEGACRASHAEIGSMAGHKLWEFNKSLTEEIWHERWKRLKETDAENVELIVTGPSEEETFLEAVITIISFGGRDLYVSHGRDVTERKQMESALNSASELFSKIFQTSPIGICISTAAEGRYAEVNQAFVEMYGFNHRDEVIGKTSRELNTFANIEERGVRVADLRKNMPLRSYYYPYRHQSGEVREALCASDMIDLDGQECIVTMFQDVTDSKRTEDALRESEEKYRQVFSTVSDAIMLLDVETRRFIDVNDSALRTYGYSRSEMLHMRLDDINTEALDLSRLLAEIVAGGRARIPVRYHKRKDGKVFPVEISADIVSMGGRQVLVEVIRDITERLRAEDALRENEETLRTLIKVLPIGVSLVAPDNRIIQMNPALETMMQLSKEDLLRGKHHKRKYLHGDGSSMTLDELPSNRVRTEGFPIHDVEIGVITEDDERLWTRVSAAPLPDNSVVVVTADITQRKLADEELEQHRHHLEDLVEQRTSELKSANEHLAALSDVKDEFVSNVSHELRTPIASLKLFAQLIKLRPEKREAYYEHIERELRRLEMMVEDLLRLSRLDQKQVDLHLDSVDLNTLVGQMVSDRQTLAESTGLVLDADQIPEPLPAVVDPGLIGQVLSILLTNAFNYTPQGGHVTVETRRFEDDHHWVGFCVKDTGPGFTKEERERMFTRFFRGKAGRDSGAAGTGLGLAIAREIVDRHKGRIEADSAGRGSGAQFSIWLPEHD